MKKHLIGDTVKVTWVSSDVTPSAIVCSVFNGSEVLVDSGTMTSSGNGHYYYLHTVPDTAGFYVAQTLATINGDPYKRRVKYQAQRQEVD